MFSDYWISGVDRFSDYSVSGLDRFSDYWVSCLDRFLGYSVVGINSFDCRWIYCFESVIYVTFPTGLILYRDMSALKLPHNIKLKKKEKYSTEQIFESVNNHFQLNFNNSSRVVVEHVMNFSQSAVYFSYKKATHNWQWQIDIAHNG